MTVEDAKRFNRKLGAHALGDKEPFEMFSGCNASRVKKREKWLP